jgi:hypothetical protein
VVLQQESYFVVPDHARSPRGLRDGADPAAASSDRSRSKRANIKMD